MFRHSDGAAQKGQATWHGPIGYHIKKLEVLVSIVDLEKFPLKTALQE